MWSLAEQLATLKEGTHSNPTIRLSQVSERFGVRYFALLREPAGLRTLDDSLVMDNWPPGLLKQVGKKSTRPISELFVRSRESVVPFFWHPEPHVQERPDDLAKHFLDFLQETEIISGLIVPVTYRSEFGIVVFGGLTKMLDRNAIAALHHTSLLTFEEWCRSDQVFPHSTSGRIARDISQLEHTCIYRVSVGEPINEIGNKLGLSEHTVCRVLEHAAFKLEAASHSHMIATALRRGIID